MSLACATFLSGGCLIFSALIKIYPQRSYKSQELYQKPRLSMLVYFLRKWFAAGCAVSAAAKSHSNLSVKHLPDRLLCQRT